MNFDLARMQKIVDRVQRLQPPNPPPDNRFLPEEINHQIVVIEEIKGKKANRQLLIKKPKLIKSPQEDQRLLLIQKENYLKKKQRELEMEQVKQELAGQKRLEKVKLEHETQKALGVVKIVKEQSQITRELKIKKWNDDEFNKKRTKNINSSNHQNSIDSSYVSMNMNTSIIKKQISDYHTLPRDQYNRIYKTNVSPPKA